MGQDTTLRNLALLNVLWDGGEMATDRRSKPSFVLRGRRVMSIRTWRAKGFPRMRTQPLSAL